MAHTQHNGHSAKRSDAPNEWDCSRLRDRFVRLNALVTRRKVASPQAWRPAVPPIGWAAPSGPATYAFHALVG